MRTARTVSPQSSPVSASTAVARADSLAAGAQASSRSRNTRSAPAARGNLAHVRVARRRRELAAAGPDGGHACSVVRWSRPRAARPGGRRRDRAGRGTRCRCRHPVRVRDGRCAPGVSLSVPPAPARSWSRGPDRRSSRTCRERAGARRREVAGVVDRCGRNILGEEHLHRVVERVPADPVGDQRVDLVGALPGAGSGRHTRDAPQGRVCRSRGTGARRCSTMHWISRSIGHRTCGRRCVVRWRRPGYRCGPGSVRVGRRPASPARRAGPAVRSG